MKSLIKYVAFAVVMGLLFCSFDAMAANNTSDVFKTVFTTLGNVFKNVRIIVYIIGAFGLIGVAIGGIVGKINFKWLGYLAAGLAIVAVADLVVSYAIGARDNTSSEQVQWDENYLK